MDITEINLELPCDFPADIMSKEDEPVEVEMETDSGTVIGGSAAKVIIDDESCCDILEMNEYTLESRTTTGGSNDDDKVAEEVFTESMQDILMLQQDDNEDFLFRINCCERISKKTRRKRQKKFKKFKIDPKDLEELPKKPRVNHFVAIQITNEQIIEQVKHVQEKILGSALPQHFNQKMKLKTRKSARPDPPQGQEEDEGEVTAAIFKDAMERLESLHFTLSVMALRNQSDIERAKQAMESCWARHRPTFEDDPLSIDVHGVGHFGNKVIFAKVQSQDQITRLECLANDLRHEFEKSEIIQDSSPFKAHMTIAKMSRSKTLHKKKIRAFPSEIWIDHEPHYFGKQPVQSLQLLAMTRDPSTRYYKIVADYKLTE